VLRPTERSIKEQAEYLYSMRPIDESEQVIDRLTSLNYRPNLKCRDCNYRTTSYDHWIRHKMKTNHRMELRSRYER
jgi:hypothetical protein